MIRKAADGPGTAFPLLAAGLLILVLAGAPCAQTRLLVFSKTLGFRHSVIPLSRKTIMDLGSKSGYLVDTTEDSKAFTSANLARYKAVFFNHTIGDVFDSAQQAALQDFIRKGGGYAGLHASSATEENWKWYGSLVGAYFKDHSAVVQASLRIDNRTHASTAALPAAWSRKDEWYNFNVNPRSSVQVLITVDEKTYQGGTMGADHPIAWYHDFEGGRSWYSALGHTEESYSEPAFLAHIGGGIEYALGRKPTRVHAQEPLLSRPRTPPNSHMSAPGILAVRGPSGDWYSVAGERLFGLRAWKPARFPFASDAP